MNEEQKRLVDDCNNELTKIELWIKENPTHSNVAFLVSYAVIKTSGTIELIFKQIIYDYLSRGARNETQKYLSTMIIDSSCNPSTGAIEKMLESVDGNLKVQFHNALEDQEKTDLNALVTLRNDIAHGRTNNPTIGIVIRYFAAGEKVLNKLFSSLNPVE